MKTKLIEVAVAVGVVGLAQRLLAGVVSVNFDTYPNGDEVPEGAVIDQQYASLGVTFSSTNGSAKSRRCCTKPSSNPNYLVGTPDTFQPITMDLTAPARKMDVTLVSVGDATVTATAFGGDLVTVLDGVSVTNPGKGVGIDTLDRISLAGRWITRVRFEITKPFPGDGFGIDDLLLEIPERPEVAVVLPANGAKFIVGDTISVAASASDRDGTVVDVAFRAGTNLLGADTTIPYTLNWTNPPAGQYALTAIATDNDGLSSTSAPVHITVVGPCTPSPCGLIGWWSGEGNIGDRVTGCEAVKVGSGNVSFDNGQVGEALQFDLTANLEMPHDPAYNLTDLTIEAWIKLDGIGTYNRVVLYKGLGGNLTVAYSLNIHGSTPNIVVGPKGRIWGPNTPGVLTLFLSDGINDHAFHSQRVLPIGELVHVAATAGTTAATNAVRLYVNGELDAAYPLQVTPRVTTDALQIGGVTRQPQNTFAGLIDELALYRRVLAPEEIRAIYLAGPAGKCPELPNCWPPTLAPIADLELWEDTEASVAVRVGDDDYPTNRLLQCSNRGIHLVRTDATSWNESLIPTDRTQIHGTNANRTLTLHPATNAFGEGWILLTADDGGQTVGELFKVTVTAVNDPPSFIPGDGPEVLEDSGPTSIANWATALNPGPANEADQGLRPFKLTTTPTNLFGTLPSLDLDGTLHFAPATNAFGTNVVTVVLQDTGGTENGGVDVVTNSFTLKVIAVNDPPTLDPIAHRTNRINAAEQTVPLTGITTGAANEIQRLEVTPSSDNPGLVEPWVTYSSPAATETLSYQPKPGRSGVATITVTVKDGGDTAHGGANQTNRQFQITVSPNIPPVVTLTNPPNGSRFDAPATFPLQAAASDQDGRVTGVEFFQRTIPSTIWVRLGQAAVPPYQWTVSNLPAAEYEFYAQATDNDGARADSSVVAISVIRTNILTLTLTSPAAGASYCPGAPIVFAAEIRGTVPSGSVVEFVSPAGLIETATSAPFAVLRRDGLSSGTYELHARLVDGSGTRWAVSATNQFEVLPTCGDVAILRNYPDPIVERMVELFYDERMLPFVRNGVDVFDQGKVGLTRLLGYKLIIWAALDRVGEGLTDDDVRLLGDLRAAGKSLYLIGVPVVSDTALLSTEGLASWERLAGVRPSGSAADPIEILVHPAGYGDPIFQTTPGGFVFPPLTFTATAAQPLELLVTDDVQVKCTVNDAREIPVMIVTPPVCDLDEGQARLATQSFALEESVPSRNLFKNTALWLLRGWYCENLELQLGLIAGPADGCAHEDLVYAYFVEHSGACGAAGVTLRQELPEGWQLVEVEGPDTDVAQVGPYVYVNLGCLDQSQRHEVRLHLRATQPGRFEHVVEVRAEAEAYKPEKHQLTVTTVIESCATPRLELRRSEPNRLMLRLFGAGGRLYRIQASRDLEDWADLGVLSGPEGQREVNPDFAHRFFRALWP